MVVTISVFHPKKNCMMFNEKKITAIVDFLASDMGYGSLSIAETPVIFYNSLKEKNYPQVLCLSLQWSD